MPGSRYSKLLVISNVGITFLVLFYGYLTVLSLAFLDSTKEIGLNHVFLEQTETQQKYFCGRVKAANVQTRTFKDFQK